MVVGLALLVIALVLRGVSANRHVRGRLLASAFLFAVYAAISAALLYGSYFSPDLRRQLGLALPLLLSFGVINGAVALVINPWRVDRLPDRFPTIVQDAIGIALFALTATLLLQERIFATSAVGAVVIGLALQDTLGNLFAGLAVQIEKPFHVGQWVNVAGKDGLVTEVTWRATKIRTKAGNFVIVPNSALARDTITNYSEPTDEVRIELEIGAGYDTPPNDVKATILAALGDEPQILKIPVPEVLVADFAQSAIAYRIRVWTRDFGRDELLRDRIRSAAYYAFRRAGIVMPYPVQVTLHSSRGHGPDCSGRDPPEIPRARPPVPWRSQFLECVAELGSPPQRTQRTRRKSPVPSGFALCVLRAHRGGEVSSLISQCALGSLHLLYSRYPCSYPC